MFFVSTNILFSSTAKSQSTVGNVVDSFDSPGRYPTGLAWDGQYLWNADADSDKIYKINPSTGEVVKSFDSPGELPWGLTWDGQYLWNTDFETDKIYKIDVGLTKPLPPLETTVPEPITPETISLSPESPPSSTEPKFRVSRLNSVIVVGAIIFVALGIVGVTVSKRRPPEPTYQVPYQEKPVIIPKKPVIQEKVIEREALKCIVCRLEIKGGEDIVLCPHCKNPSHRERLSEWLRMRGKCPM